MSDTQDKMIRDLESAGEIDHEAMARVRKIVADYEVAKAARIARTLATLTKAAADLESLREGLAGDLVYAGRFTKFVDIVYALVVAWLAEADDQYDKASH